MNVQSHPVEHFRLMSEIAFGLTKIPAQFMEHHYSNEAFGSWWLKYSCSGHQFRLVFDGIDHIISIQKSNVDSWENIDSKHVNMPTSSEIINYISEVLNKK